MHFSCIIAIDQREAKRKTKMQAVTVSSKFQISIPKNVRQRLHIRPGQKLAISVGEGAVRLVPVPTLDEIAGSLPGLSMEGLRDEEDRI